MRSAPPLARYNPTGNGSLFHRRAAPLSLTRLDRRRIGEASIRRWLDILITCDQAVLDDLHGRISVSVVTIKRYTGTENLTLYSFGTGFIIHSTRSRVLVCTDSTIIKEGETLYVHFSDDTSQKADVFIERTKSGHAILSVQSDNQNQHPVSFSAEEAKREEICTIARVMHDQQPGIIAPSCKLGQKMVGKKFAVTIPIGRLGNKDDDQHLLGAAVFGLNGCVVGTVCSISHVHGLKFALHSYHFLDELEKSLQDKDKRVFVSVKINKNLPSIF
uniref:Uncharacterized protein n=1 Tax=Leersia perrieri TaxID=77586 RepID=A0A0D9VV76_9ORYZ